MNRTKPRANRPTRPYDSEALSTWAADVLAAGVDEELPELDEELPVPLLLLPVEAVPAVPSAVSPGARLAVAFAARAW